MVSTSYFILALALLSTQASAVTDYKTNRKNYRQKWLGAEKATQIQKTTWNGRAKRDLAGHHDEAHIIKAANDTNSELNTQGNPAEYLEHNYEIIPDFNPSRSSSERRSAEMLAEEEMQYLTEPDDGDTSVAAVEGGNVTRVNMCCRPHQLYDYNLLKCYDSNTTVVPVFHNKKGARLRDVHYSLNIGRPNCTIFALSPSTANPDDYFILTIDGELVVGNYSAGFAGSPEFTIARNKYCLLFTEPHAMEALVCFEDNGLTDATEARYDFQRKVYPVCWVISTVFLLLTLLVYCLLKELREDLLGKSFMFSIGMLAVAQILLLISRWSRDQIVHTMPCFMLASLMHFSFLATFMWLNVISYQVFCSFWRSNSSRSSRCSQLKWQCLYAYGVAFIVAGLAVLDDVLSSYGYRLFNPGFASVTCWFANTQSAIAYLVGPSSVVLIVNLVFFCLAAYKMCSLQKQSQLNSIHYSQYLKLFVLMGVSWIFEMKSFMFTIIDKNSPIHYFWVATDLVNILQGVLIFILFVCRKPVLRHLARRICGDKACIKASDHGQEGDTVTAPCNTVV